MIYLDGDTLIYGDLYEMYQLTFYEIEIMNLKLIREEHFYDTFRNYYLKFKKKRIYLHDQHIINTLFRDKIGFLPPKFGIWFMSEAKIKKYNSLNPLIYTIDELREANNKPIIRHLWGKTQEGIYLP